MRCPTLVIHGDEDMVRPHAQGAALAQATGATLVTLEGGGHLPNVRDPVASTWCCGGSFASLPERTGGHA